MTRKAVAVVVLLFMVTAGCSTQKKWGQGAIGGAIIGAAAMGTAGGVIANNVNPPFKKQDSDRGAGIAIGIATGAILGALIGHAFFDEDLPPPPPPPEPPPVAKKKLVLRGVHFAFDKATLRQEAKPILEEAARMLTENPGVVVEVQGYTDGIGTAEYNLGLSERRAEAVKDFLVAQGVAASQLKARGFGKEDPVAPNDTAEGRAQNRRVELVPES